MRSDTAPCVTALGSPSRPRWERPVSVQHWPFYRQFFEWVLTHIFLLSQWTHTTCRTMRHINNISFSRLWGFSGPLVWRWYYQQNFLRFSKACLAYEQLYEVFGAHMQAWAREIIFTLVEVRKLGNYFCKYLKARHWCGLGSMVITVTSEQTCAGPLELDTPSLPRSSHKPADKVFVLEPDCQSLQTISQQKWQSGPW